MSAPNSRFILDAGGSLYEQLDTDLTTTVLGLSNDISPSFFERPSVRYATELCRSEIRAEELPHIHQAFCVGVVAILDAFTKSDLTDGQKNEIRALFVGPNTPSRLRVSHGQERRQTIRLTSLRGLKAHPEVNPIAMLLKEYYKEMYQVPDSVNPVYTGVGVAAATLDDCYETVMRAQTEEAFGIDLDEINWDSFPR